MSAIISGVAISGSRWRSQQVAQVNIHFAGEHCSQDFSGYREGGAAEGIRAANEVLAALT